MASSAVRGRFPLPPALSLPRPHARAHALLLPATAHLRSLSLGAARAPTPRPPRRPWASRASEGDLEAESSDAPEPVEAQVASSEAPEPVEAQVASTVPLEKEEVYAIVMIGSRQYFVIPGRFLYTQRLKGAKANDKVLLNKVLYVQTKKHTYIGHPIVPDTVVHAVVEEQGFDPKVLVFKYKKKKNYKRKIGHKQPNTRLRITAITGYQNALPMSEELANAIKENQKASLVPEKLVTAIKEYQDASPVPEELLTAWEKYENASQLPEELTTAIKEYLNASPMPEELITAIKEYQNASP